MRKAEAATCKYACAVLIYIFIIYASDPLRLAAHLTSADPSGYPQPCALHA